SAQQQTQPAPAASTVTAPAGPAAAAPTGSTSEAASADAGGRTLKSIAPVMKELSPWVMFMSADVIVKAVMIGLAFASLATWTIFIAKMIELTFIQRKLRAALARISDARSLAEAQFAIGAKGSVLAYMLWTWMRAGRLSEG